MKRESFLKKSVSIFIASAFFAANPGSEACARVLGTAAKAAPGAAPVSAPVFLSPGVSNAASLGVPAASLRLEGSLPTLEAPVFDEPAAAINAADRREQSPKGAADARAPASPRNAPAAAPAQSGLQFVTKAADGAVRALEASSPAPLAKKPAALETPAPAAPATALGRLSLALKTRSLQPLFDGSNARRGRGLGIREAEPEDAGVELDEQPGQPQETEVPRVSWKRVNVPGARARGLARLFRSRSDEATILAGNPRTASAVETELRSLIDANPSRFGGIRSSALETVISKRVSGRAGLADVVYVGFRQKLDGSSVEGTFLNMTVRMSAADAVIVSESAQLYPDVSVNMQETLDDSQALENAFERLGRPTGSYNDVQPVGRKVMHLGGRWRYVSVHFSESKSLLAAVDLNTGEAFAWDPRVHAQGKGELIGRGVEFDPTATGTKLDRLAMPHAEIRTSDGRTFYTDKDGWFTLEGDKPVTITATLKGKYATIRDQGASTLKITATVNPGEPIRLVFNPEGYNENTVAQVNAYRHANVVHDWLAANQIEEEINRSIPIKTNINRDCNAYYTPWSPSLNFFKSSSRCINTAYDTVVYHEYGHFVDDMIGGIVNGALSEGWGDIIGMYISGQPVLGEGFMKNRTPDYIRHGENKYQFSSRDEVHKQGQAWMGFAWKLRKFLIAKLGEQEGAAVAEALVVPVLFANVRSIPAAIEAVVMRAVGENGEIAHFEEIKAAAAAHGIAVERPNAGTVGSLVRRTGFWNWVTARVATAVERRI
jgi:hypothetical protein